MLVTIETHSATASSNFVLRLNSLKPNPPRSSRAATTLLWGGKGMPLLRFLKEQAGYIMVSARQVVRSETTNGLTRADITHSHLDMMPHEKWNEGHGLFAAPYISAWWVLEGGPMSVEMHDPKANDGLESDLWLAAKDILNPGVIVLMACEDGARIGPDRPPFAVVCTASGCSGEIADIKGLVARLSSIQSSQV